MSWIIAPVMLAGIAVLIWTAWDAARRRRNWFVWTLPVVFLGLPGLIPWLVTRRRTPVADRLPKRQVFALSVSVIALVVMRVITSIFVTSFSLPDRPHRGACDGTDAQGSGSSRRQQARLPEARSASR
jgi:uncharacterized membrane protein (DUF485 family)